MTSFTIAPTGEFSLAAAAGFGFGPTGGRRFDGSLRMAFVADGFGTAVGVVLQQDDRGIHGDVSVGADPDAVASQVARVLSLDRDGKAWLEVGERDPRIGELQRAHPGLRPVLFHSPYEAAAWAVLSARRPMAQARLLRERLAAELGTSFELDGETLHAFPLPARLLELAALEGLPADRVPRLHAVAAAALAGDLDVPRLHELGAEGAIADLQRLPGIGPFYAELVVLRGSGFADALTVVEPRVRAYAARLYDLDGPPTAAAFERLAEPWRPYRTWAVVLIRVAGDRAGWPAPARR